MSTSAPEPSIPSPVDLGIEGISDAVKIGQGGFGTVYRATQPAYGRTVAVKVISIPLADADSRRNFDRECRALGSLSNHPYVVTLFAADVSAHERPYLVMEYLPGGSLAERLRREGPMDWRRAVEIGVKLASALASAHAVGILHRDVKPENVLVSAYGEPQLADFGVARMEGGTRTATGGITGSIAHAAPEVLSGVSATTAADVWSLASTVATLIRGEAPFEVSGANTLQGLITRILTAPPADLRPLGVPDEVCAVIDAALKKDSWERTADAAAFGRSLQHAQKALGLPETAMPIVRDLPGRDDGAGPGGMTPGGPADVAATPPRQPGTEAAVVADPALPLAATATAQRAAEPVVTTPAAAEEPPLSEDVTLHRTPAAALSGGQVTPLPQPTEVPRRERSSSRWLRDRRTWIAAGAGAVAIIVFAAVFATSGGHSKAAPRAAATTLPATSPPDTVPIPRPTSLFVGSGPVGIAISPNGATAYVANFGGNTVVPINLRTDTLGAPIRVGNGPASVVITPDGKVAFVANFNGKTVVTVDLTTGTVGPEIQAASGPASLAISPNGRTIYVSSYDGGTVTPLDVATSKLGSPIRVGNEPRKPTVTANGRTLYVVNQRDNTVVSVNLATGATSAPIPVGAAPSSIALTPDGKSAYVTNFGSSTVTPIDLATGKTRAPIPVGKNPESIAITPDGRTALVADYGDNAVTPIDLATGVPGSPIPVGKGPRAIVVTADGTAAYSADADGGTLSHIKLQ